MTPVIMKSYYCLRVNINDDLKDYHSPAETGLMDTGRYDFTNVNIDKKKVWFYARGGV